jgi:hypothetical protein
VIVAPPPAAALSASPARVELAGSGAAAIRLTNNGGAAAVVDAAPAGFVIDRNGRPRVATIRDRQVRVLVRPRTVPLAAGGTASIDVVARVDARAAPGDHVALVVLGTRPRAAGGVGVRLRIGLIVVVRVPGAVVRRLRLVGLAVAHGRVTIRVRNLGNVVERLDPRALRLEIRHGGRVLRRLRAPTRELLPHGLAVLHFTCRVHGRLVVALGTIRRTIRV